MLIAGVRVKFNNVQSVSFAMKGDYSKRLRGKKDTTLVRVLFFVHLPIVLVFFGSFLVPLSVWPPRAVFHFWYFVVVIGAEVVWGLLIYPKTHTVDIVCPVTTLMQYKRGYRISNPKNYGHSYIAELFSYLGIPVSYKYVNYLILIVGVFVTINYLRVF